MRGIHIELKGENKIESGYDINNLTYQDIAILITELERIKQELIEALNSIEKDIDYWGEE